MIGDVLLMLLFTALPGAVVAGIIGAAISSRDARGEGEPDEPGIGTVRRLFLYVLALVGLVFAAIGVSLLITGVLEVTFEDLIVSEQSEALSTALAFTLVGTPAWVVFAYLAQRSLTQHPVEAYSQARRLYFVVVRGIALVFIVLNASGVLKQLSGVDDFSSHAWGWLFTWGGIWVVHQRFVAGESAPSTVTRLLERLYGYFGTVLGLVFALNGIAQLVRTPLQSIYNNASGIALVDQGLTRGLREGAILLLIGGAVWAWHWALRLLRRDLGTTLWHVQVFVFGTLPGVMLTVVPVAVLLYTVLKWFLGVPDVGSASAHFSEVPSLLGTLVAGVATWGYHRATLVEGTRGAQAQGEPERVYRYTVAAAGLLTAAIGLATVIALACEALGGGAGTLVRQSEWWRNPLIRAFTLLVIGTPLWVWYWTRVQQIAVTVTAARTSLSRRAFLFAVMGVSLIALLISLVVLLFQVLQPILDGDASREILRDARWSIAVAVTSAVVAVYYLLVLREDQEALRDLPVVEAVRRRNVLLLAPSGAGRVAEALRDVEGVRVRTWLRSDDADFGLTSTQIEALREAVLAADAAQVAVIVSGDVFEVVPYRES